MGKIKRLSKRGIAFILSLITIISLITPMSLIVNADTNGSTQMSYDPEVAKGYAGSMFKTYMAGGQDDLKIGDITENEFRAFAVLLSNFVIPMYTDIAAIDTDTDLKDDDDAAKLNGTAIDSFNTWEQFCKVWYKSGNDTSTGLMKDLLERYKNTIKTGMKPLYCLTSVDTSESDAKDCGCQAYANYLLGGRPLAAGISSDCKKSFSPLFCWYDDKGDAHIVYSLNRSSEYATGEAIAAFVTTINMKRVSHFADADTSPEESGRLYVSPFGDICTVEPNNKGKFIVIIPACMNPYAFQYDGDHVEACQKIYINNLFMIGNFLDLTQLNNIANSEKFADFFEDDGVTLNKGHMKYWFSADVTTNGDDGHKGVKLHNLMHCSSDSMVPYVNARCDAPAAGIAVYGYHPKKDDGVKDEGHATNTYLAAIQPLWSVASLFSTDNHNCIAMVSRSSLLNRYTDDERKFENAVFYLGNEEDFEFGENGKKFNKNYPSFRSYMPFAYNSEKSGVDFMRLPFSNYGAGNKATTNYAYLMGVNYDNDVRGYIAVFNNKLLDLEDIMSNYGSQFNWKNIKADKEIEIGTERKKIVSEIIVPKIANFFGKVNKNDPNDATQASGDSETKYLVFALGRRVNYMNAHSVAMGESWFGKKYNIQSSGIPSYMTSLYQINIEHVVSKIGLFGPFTDDNGDIKSVKTINICDDGKDTVLKKTGHNGNCAVDCSLTFETDGGWSTDDVNKISTAIMPEYLYALDGVVGSGGNTLQFGDDGARLNYNRNLFTNIYWAYIEDIVGITAKNVHEGIDAGKQSLEEQKRVFDHLPRIPDVSNFRTSIFNVSDDSDWETQKNEKDREDRNEDIADKIHKILNIGETIGNGLKDAARYVTNWLKAMVDSLFIGWHNHMVGVDTTAGWTGTTQNIGNATKSGVYSTAMGYMTTPTFNSLPVTGWIMANFTLIYVILMIFIVVILLMMVITRARRLPQAILIFICMAFLIILPANMLNGAISISNEAAEKIFANKFQYWAVMQHAEYITNQNIAKNANQAALLDNLDRNSESTKVGGVTLKWMAPKKWGIAEQIQSSAGTTRGLRLFLYLAGDVLDQEDYTHYQAGDTYIYRPYLALFTEAHSLYKRLQSEKIINEDSNSKTNNLYKVSQNIVNTWTKNNSKYKVLNSMGTNKLISNSLYFTSDGKVRTDKTSDGKSYASNFFRYTTHRGDSILRSAVGGTGAGKDGIMTYPLAYYDSYYHDANIITDKNNMFSNNERIYDMYLDEQLISRLFAFKIDNVYWDTNHGTIWTSDSGNYESPCGLWLSNKKNPNTRHYSGDTSKDDLDKTFYSSGVQAYFDYSESPYYYFYNVFMDMQIHTDNGGKISGSEDFLALLLSDETFKVVNQQSPAYGEFKDYLDMEGLFKFVIPLLNYGNGNAHKYFEKYGSTVDRTEFLDDSDYESSGVEETTSVEESEAESSTDSSDSSDEESSKESSSESSTINTVTITKDPKTKAEDSYNKHKQQLQAIYNMYCPWVDQFLAANTKTTKIKSGYGWVELSNPCDPADYQYFGRPMAFSKAEAVIRGYKDYDLSTVETKIQKVLNDSYYDIIELINYKDLTSIAPTDANSYAAKEGWKGNEILVSAAAMIATFHFNQEFSDNGFMSTDITLYPQSYELKNMNFDAYLRIIMGNSMGINQVQLMRDDSASLTVYEKFIHETSVFSALVLIIEDVLAVFLIPILKILLITVVFVLALALAVSCIINKPEHMIKIFLTTYILPLFAMIAIFVAHTLVISWFVGEGSSAGLIDTHSISVTTGDPTVTLLLMIVVDLITVILMWKLLKFAAKSTAKYIQDIGNGIASLTKGTFSGLAKIVTAAAGIGTVAVGAASLAAGAVKSTASGVTGVGKAAVNKHTTNKQMRLDKKRNKLLKEGSEGTDTGKGKGKGKGKVNGNANGNGNVNGNEKTANKDLAADVKAIRQKLEKGFNPEGMKQESSKQAEAKEEPKKVQAASPEASKAEKKPSAGAQKAQQLYKRKLTRKETQAAAMQSAMTGDNAGLKQAQADLDKLIAEQNALVSKYGATWNKGKKKFTSKSNNAEQNRQLNEMQRKINASRATVNTLKQKAEAAKSSAGGSGKQPRKVMKVKK